jgi:hypothetical protein
MDFYVHIIDSKTGCQHPVLLPGKFSAHWGHLERGGAFPLDQNVTLRSKAESVVHASEEWLTGCAAAAGREFAKNEPNIPGFSLQADFDLYTETCVPKGAWAASESELNKGERSHYVC